MKKSKLKVKPPSRPSNFMRGGLYNSKYISDSNYQTGGPISKAQNSYLKKLKETETGIDDILGKPMKRAFKNSAPNQDEEPVDNIRHTLGGMYTTEALSKKIPGLPKAFSAIGSNILGLSHEVMTLLKDQRPWNEKIPESSEDMLNNFVGSLISLIPFMSESDKEDVIWKLSVNNLLPDGIENTPMGDQYFTEEQQRNLKPALYNTDISEEIFQGGFLPEVLITAPRKKQGGQIKNKDSDRAMVYGIADILKMVKNKDNRQQIAGEMIKDFNRDKIKYNKQNFLKASNLSQQGGVPNPLPQYGNAGDYYKQLMDTIQGANLFNNPAENLPDFDKYYNNKVKEYLDQGKYRPQTDGGTNYLVDTTTGERFTTKEMRKKIGIEYDSLKAGGKSFAEQAPIGGALAGLLDLQTAEADEIMNRKKGYFDNSLSQTSWSPMGFSQEGGDQEMDDDDDEDENDDNENSDTNINEFINVIKAYAEDLGFTNEDGSITKDQMIELLRLLESDMNADLEREAFAQLLSFFEDDDDEPLHEQIRKYWNRGVIPMNRREDVLKYSSDPVPHLEQGENFPRPETFKCGGLVMKKKDGGLSRWFKEKWVDIKTGEECGRQSGEKRGYPACRPSVKVSSDTPKTVGEMSASEKEKFKRTKTSSKRIPYSHRNGGTPTNPELYSKVKSEAKKKFSSWPSAYGSSYLVREYKKRGGTYSQNGGYMNTMQQMMGYRDNSPFRNMPYQTFNTNRLTMRGVSRPLFAISDTGASTIMRPGYDYTFPGASSVMEIPMAQSGKFFKKVGNVFGDFGRSVADSIGNRYGLWDIDNSKYKTKLGQKYSGAWDKFNRNLGKAGAAAVSTLVPGLGTAIGGATSAGINRLEGNMPQNPMMDEFQPQGAPQQSGQSQGLGMLNQLSFLLPMFQNALLGPSSPYNTNTNMNNPYDMSFLNMREGGIPDRYKNMGFTKVGQKRQSDRPGKKWSVLAKKGDQYKVVHGGAEGMSDFTKHRNEERRDRFWDRMGGKNSAKAKDPFSPLYWHKRFGTWQNGGIIPPPPSRPF